jgi:hypothetical protein
MKNYFFKMSPQLIAAIFLVVWAATGLGIIPLYGPLFSDLLDSSSLPWLTNQVLRQGPPMCVVIGVLSAIIIAGVPQLTANRILWRSVLLLLFILLLVAVFALVLPLYKFYILMPRQ